MRVKEGFGVLLRGVADVTALGISDGEDFLVKTMKVVHRLFQLDESLYAHSLIESEVGFVGHCVVDCGIDDGFVELEHAVGHIGQMLRHLVLVHVQSYAKEGTALVYQVD